MASRTRKVKVRPRRVIGAIAVILVVTFGADCVKRVFSNDEHHNLVIDGDFAEYPTMPETPQQENAVTLANDESAPTETVGVENIGQHQLILSEAKVAEGKLAVYGQDRPVKSGYAGDMVGLLNVKNEYYSLYSESIQLESDAAEALNGLMEDYNNETGLSDFVVYGTDDTYTGEDSCCPESFSESALGTSVDLALKAYGEVIEYDGLDDESWLVENCWKYGFIVRYPKGKDTATGHSYCPWHIRYVGKVHSAVMHETDMCLEDYIRFLADFTLDKPFQYTYDDVDYTIFSVKSTGESTVTYVPLSSSYSVSGNNKDGFIINTPKS